MATSQGDYVIVGKPFDRDWMAWAGGLDKWGPFGQERRFLTPQDAQVYLQDARRDAKHLYFFVFLVYHSIMNVITIPRRFARKDDLVVIPRREYESLLKQKVAVLPVVKLTQSEKRAFAQSERELARGEYVTLEQLEHDLGNSRAKKR